MPSPTTPSALATPATAGCSHLSARITPRSNDADAVADHGEDEAGQPEWRLQIQVEHESADEPCDGRPRPVALERRADRNQQQDQRVVPAIEIAVDDVQLQFEQRQQHQRDAQRPITPSFMPATTAAHGRRKVCAGSPSGGPGPPARARRPLACAERTRPTGRPGGYSLCWSPLVTTASPTFDLGGRLDQRHFRGRAPSPVATLRSPDGEPHAHAETRVRQQLHGRAGSAVTRTILPTRAPLDTTGIPRATPSPEPLSISMVSCRIDGVPPVTRAGTEAMSPTLVRLQLVERSFAVRAWRPGRR